MWGPSPKGWGFWLLRAFQLFLSKTQVQLLFRSTQGDGWSAPSCKIRDRSLFLWKPPTMWVTWSPSTWSSWRRFKPPHGYSASQTTCPQTCSIPSSVRVSGFQKISSRSLTTLPWSPTSLQAHQLTNKGEKNLLRPNADFDSRLWAGSAAAAWCSWRPSPPRRGGHSKMMSCCLTWPTSLSSSPLWSCLSPWLSSSPSSSGWPSTATSLHWTCWTSRSQRWPASLCRSLPSRSLWTSRGLLSLLFFRRSSLSEREEPTTCSSTFPRQRDEATRRGNQQIFIQNLALKAKRVYLSA